MPRNGSGRCLVRAWCVVVIGVSVVTLTRALQASVSASGEIRAECERTLAELYAESDAHEEGLMAMVAVRACVHMCVCVCVCACVFVCLCICIRVYAFMHVCMLSSVLMTRGLRVCKVYVCLRAWACKTG